MTATLKNRKISQANEAEERKYTQEILVIKRA
jgi:hypothetical protein